MASRREFLQAGIAASILPASILPADAAARAAREGLADAGRGAAGDAAAFRDPALFHKVIYDERFMASVAYAYEMAKLGGRVRAIRGDITELWFDDLDLRWRQEPAPVAGLTAHGALFCLERLAWDRGMRVLLREEQQETDGETPLISWVIGPRDPAPPAAKGGR